MVSDLKQLHDKLLAKKPADVSHDVASCLLCNVSDDLEDTTPGGGAMSGYTEEDLSTAVRAAVEEATAPLQAKIDEINASQEAEAVENRIAEAVAPLNEKVAELEAKLDTATLEAEAAKKELDDTTAYLEAAVEEAQEKAAADARQEDRVNAVKEAVSFPEEYIAERASKWAAMSEEDFEAALSEWKLIAPKKSEAKAEEINDEIPTETAMTASAETSTEGFGLVRDFFDATLKGNDPRTL